MFHNNQSSGSNQPLQNFRFPQQSEMKPVRQVELEVRLGQLKSQSNDNSNPYYDNSYRNNRDIYRENNNNYSYNDLKNSTPIQNQRPPVNRNDDSAQNQRRNYPIEDTKPAGQNSAIKGSFFDNFGDDKRHNNIQSEYRDYVRKQNNRDYQPSEIGGFYKGQQGQESNGRDKSNGRGRKAQNQSAVNQKEDWYVQNYNVGILPGMGKPEDGGRASIAKQRTVDVSPMQERYTNQQTRGIERQNTRDDVGSARLNGRGGSQLANAGSRIVDGDRMNDDFRGLGSRLDQIKVPESFGDYGNLEQRKDIYNNVQFVQSPQFSRNRELFNYPKTTTADFDGIINEQDYGYNGNRAGSVHDASDWRSNAIKKLSSVPAYESSEFKGAMNSNQRSLVNMGLSSEIANSRATANDDGGDKAGTNWLKQRESEEVDKKQKQKEELQKVYREQMEEKKRKKDEEKRKQWLEDQKEDERLRKENEEIQRQFTLEIQKKKEQEIAKESAQAKLNEVVEDFTTAANRRKQNKHNKAFDTSEENTLRREVYQKPEPAQEREIEYEREVRYDPPPRRLEDLIKETAKFVENETQFKKRVEFSKDPELEVHKAVMRRMDATLDEQLDKMKRDVSVHTQLLRDSQATYMQQALVASELRQNAQKDLLRLREDLRMQQIEEETRPFQNLNLTPAQDRGDYSLKQAPSNKQLLTKAPEKSGIRLGTKNYSKMQPIQSYDNEDDIDLGGSSRMGMTLDVDTHYVPVKGLGDLSLETSRGESGARNSHKYALESKDEMVEYGYDAAKNKFDSLFPEQKKTQNYDNNKFSNSDAHIEHNYRAAIKEVKHGAIEQNEYRFNYMKGPTQVRQYEKSQKSVKNNDNFGDVEGADEIERLDNLLKRYKENTRQQREDEDEMELAQETNIKPIVVVHHNNENNKIVSHQQFDDLGDYELPDREENDINLDENNGDALDIEVDGNLHVEA